MRREDWDARYSTVENLWSAKPNRFLVAEVGELQPGRALDLACGEGQNAIWLASLGWDVLGVDYSQVAVEKAQQRAERDGVAADFICADLVEYEPERDAFDLVLVLYLHIPSTHRASVHAKAAAALATHGTFVLLGHDRTNLADGVGGPSDPDILYAAEEIAAELPGLVIEKATTVLRDVDGEERDAIDTIVRARRPAPS
jgi:2-polyprenyl-3-methyl-5-hydroxy-6-metoxy-1,4-benzoquinol methylase